MTPAPTSTRVVAGRTVGSVGLGTALLGLLGKDVDEAAQTIHAALDAGMRVIDSAAVYTPDVARPGFADALVARAVARWDGPADEVVHVTKAGHRRIADGFGPDAFVIDARPGAIRGDVEASLRATGVERLDLVLLHQPDPEVPLADSVGALAELQREGAIEHIGLSNVDGRQVEEAATIARVAAVQNQYSVAPEPVHIRDGLPRSRDDSRAVIEWCETAGVAFLAYSPLGSGRTAKRLGELLPGLATVAAARGASVAQVALAWLLHQSDVMLPIPGCTRPATAVDSAAAMHLALTDAEAGAIGV